MATDSITAKIDDARRELLDLTLRNPLLNYRATRGLAVTEADPVRVFDVLVRENRTMSFLSQPEENEPSPQESFVAMPDKDEADTATPAPNQLQTQMAADDLHARLLRTYYRANTLVQEQGVNTLFIALGMVVWYDINASDQERRAPLVLIPVSLERTNVKTRFCIKYTDEEVGENVSYKEKVLVDFGLDLPDLRQTDDHDADDEDIDIARYFREIEDCIRGMERWYIDTTSVALGFFSFHKLLMYRDLDSKKWPLGRGPTESRVIRALFEDGFAEPESAIEDNDFLDDHLHPKDTCHVVDADSSQALAIFDVKNGRNLVIQGPPGTGKSQTIVNILAEAIGQNKKVLFVSEKVAALEVVKRRLDEIDLGAPCLELHSRKTNKRAVLEELNRTINLENPSSAESGDNFASLAQERQRLNAYAQAVNAPVGETGVTPISAYGLLMRIWNSLKGDRDSVPRLEVPGIDSWARAEFSRRLEIVADLQETLKTIVPLKEHVFWGINSKDPLLDRGVLREKIHAARVALEDLCAATCALGNGLMLQDSPADIASAEKLIAAAQYVVDAPNLVGINFAATEWEECQGSIGVLRETGQRWASLRARYDSVLTPAAWRTDVSAIRRTFATIGRRAFRRWLSMGYWRSRKSLATLCRSALPGDVEEQVTLADAILEERQLRETLERLAPVASAALGDQWQGESTTWGTVVPAIEWTLHLFNLVEDGKIDQRIVRSLLNRLSLASLRELLEQAKTAQDSYVTSVRDVLGFLDMDCEKRFGHADGFFGLSLDEQGCLLEAWSSRADTVQDIVRINNALNAAKEAELGAVASAAERPDASESLTNWFESARYKAILSCAFKRPALAQFQRAIHERHVKRFQYLDSEAIVLNRTKVSGAHLMNRLWGGDGSILRREFAKKRQHLPIRQLMKRAGSAIQAIKPVFMMSPLSIATYLEPGSLHFDLVVFDEASQVRPVDALGALCRTDQAVVVGDDRQLPPTWFFDASLQSDDENYDERVTTGIESILQLMNSKGCPSRMLRWHYRSRHESLIAVSNQEFYDNKLVVFPSPESHKEGLGLRYHHLPDTVYDRGRSKINRQEAAAVAKAVMEHARQHPGLTLGVAAFSAAQAEAILDELEMLRKQDSDCERFFGDEDHPEEPFFVKNLENVQGDERDVIFISVGYGRDANGQTAMNFGPLNQDRGECRLNVIITRAKRRCEVFTNLHADDIDLGRTSSIGVRAFKTFLAYAESGALPADAPAPSGREVESPFQAAVVSQLRSKGYEAHEEVASGSKFIDIAIVDPERPGRYILGIECDGATYHSSRSARDRDRIREQVLRGLGWQLHRIWSTDWYLSEERELQRTLDAIEKARHEGNHNSAT